MCAMKYLLDLLRPYARNLNLLRMDFKVLAKGTPVEKLWEDGSAFQGPYYLLNISDLVRMLIMNRVKKPENVSTYDSDII